MMLCPNWGCRPETRLPGPGHTGSLLAPTAPTAAAADIKHDIKHDSSLLPPMGATAAMHDPSLHGAYMNDSSAAVTTDDECFGTCGFRPAIDCPDQFRRCESTTQTKMIHPSETTAQTTAITTTPTAFSPTDNNFAMPVNFDFGNL